ncbi:thioredoxin family protein [Tenacibaculum piscium]|uniref:Thioredoxin domain-containing protein n=1 Tax=Tenacibaculum piscium TaxID=1458515 RepID=A0A2H1YHU2_9FLAO|nr:thioredoxin family protein [Tenacibaculum piscium]MBE7629717.1 thioredoxin fold domain-containing protein [Tenacibaculum piscium]MBE7671510.1 thioredoxin fold domain-containing protein [Tenacibaculum piscium]MBE7690633.1 thioredoxin fold domain-containing protein [Tenacibaculum piscium]MCG8182552.1 thioredoxin family protein [Tenacibaculum piscium]MCG8203944.1 thioredoxin family protein [Tenacibaculum piscium]
MKKIGIILVFLLAVHTVSAQQSVVAHQEINQEANQEVKWEQSFDTAIKKAKKENKPVLVFFTGSDWCPPCQTIDRELFNTDKFKGFSDEKLILYKADFPRNRDLVSSEAKKENNELQYRYGINAFPTVVVVNAKGNVLGKKKGAYMAAYYYPFLQSIITNN